MSYSCTLSGYGRGRPPGAGRWQQDGGVHHDADQDRVSLGAPRPDLREGRVWRPSRAKIAPLLPSPPNFSPCIETPSRAAWRLMGRCGGTHARARSLRPTGRNPCTAAVGLPRTLSPGLSRWQWRAASKRVPCWRTVTRAIATVDRCHSSGRSSCTGRTVLYQKAIKNISVNMSTSYGPPKTITCRFWATR